MAKEIGFFVKNKTGFKCYSGPHYSLKAARDDARSKGPDLEIYHGCLERDKDGFVITDSDLYLIPKLRKNDD